MSDQSNPTILEWKRTEALRASFLSGELTDGQGLRAEVKEAWDRCRHAGVPPSLRAVPTLLDPAELKAYRAGHPVYRTGEPALAAAADLLEGTGCGLVLADGRGTVLHVGGDAGMVRVAERVGSLPGASWREDLVGNNALGSSLVTGEPVHFRFHEHWGEGWTDWFCAAFPVRGDDSPVPQAALALVAHRKLPDARMMAWAGRLAQILERRVLGPVEGRVQDLRKEAARLSRWFPDHLAMAVDRQGALVWSNGPVPGELRQALPAAVDELRSLEPRGEKELFFADRDPALALPLWSGCDHLGYLLVTRRPSGPATLPDSDGGGQGGRPAPCVVAGPAERRMVFSPDQVMAARSLGGRVYIVTETGTWPTPYDSIRELSERLPTGDFFQVDRGCLVNLGRIREIHLMFNRTVTLVLADRKGTEIPVSRRRTAALRRLVKF